MTDASVWDDCLPAFSRYGDIQHVDASLDDGIEAIAERALTTAPGRFVMIGFSFGGYVAREIARRAPERLQALILIATSARGKPEKQAAADRRLAAAMPAAFSGLSRRAIETSLHPDHADEKTIERIRAMSLRLGGEVFRRQMTMRRVGDVERLSEIRCPTLVISASDDRLRSREEAEELWAGIHGAKFSVIYGSGHMLPIEAPRELASITVNWLDRLKIAG
jgi:pimeloyl-ACP methyl ester carboxylesterase